MNKIQYQEYLQSDKWRQKADNAKERVGWHCQVCNASGIQNQLHAHHRTYENLGNEPPEDITVLCRKCHALFHDKLARDDVAMALLDDLPDALRRWDIPSYQDNNYQCDEQWEYYEEGKRLIRLGSAWLGRGTEGAAQGHSSWYGKAIAILNDYLYLAHDSETCPKCKQAEIEG